MGMVQDDEFESELVEESRRKVNRIGGIFWVIDG